MQNDVPTMSSEQFAKLVVQLAIWTKGQCFHLRQVVCWPSLLSDNLVVNCRHYCSVCSVCVGDKHVMLWPNTTFLPKILALKFINPPINLSSLADENLPRLVLCPVNALCGSDWQVTDQLFVCFWEHHRGALLSKKNVLLLPCRQNYKEHQFQTFVERQHKTQCLPSTMSKGNHPGGVKHETAAWTFTCFWFHDRGHLG